MREQPLQELFDQFTFQLRIHACVNGQVDPNQCLYSLRLTPDLTEPGDFPDSIIFQSEDALALNARGVVVISVVATRRSSVLTAAQSIRADIAAQSVRAETAAQSVRTDTAAESIDMNAEDTRMNMDPNNIDSNNAPAPTSIYLCRSLPFNIELWPNAPDSADGTWFKGIMTLSGPFTFQYRSSSTRPEDATIQSIRWSCHHPCLASIMYGIQSESLFTTDTVIVGMQMVGQRTRTRVLLRGNAFP